tara:strand:- start:12166 stop:12369 length:204 start_codon:yes stop_codon:yes gene_type:complete
MASNKPTTCSDTIIASSRGALSSFVLEQPSVEKITNAKPNQFLNFIFINSKCQTLITGVLLYNLYEG